MLPQQYRPIELKKCTQGLKGVLKNVPMYSLQVTVLSSIPDIIQESNNSRTRPMQLNLVDEDKPSAFPTVSPAIRRGWHRRCRPNVCRTAYHSAKAIMTGWVLAFCIEERDTVNNIDDLARQSTMHPPISAYASSPYLEKASWQYRSARWPCHERAQAKPSTIISNRPSLDIGQADGEEHKQDIYHDDVSLLAIQRHRYKPIDKSESVYYQQERFNV